MNGPTDFPSTNFPIHKNTGSLPPIEKTAAIAGSHKVTNRPKAPEKGKTHEMYGLAGVRLPPIETKNSKDPTINKAQQLHKSPLRGVEKNIKPNSSE